MIVIFSVLFLLNSNTRHTIYIGEKKNWCIAMTANFYILTYWKYIATITCFRPSSCNYPTHETSFDRRIFRGYRQIYLFICILLSYSFLSRTDRITIIINAIFNGWDCDGKSPNSNWFHFHSDCAFAIKSLLFIS